jgi:hypothetical protein
MIRLNRKVVRELGISDHRRRKPLVVMLCEGGINLGIRVKGTRRWLYVPMVAVWQLAARMEAQRIKEDRAEARRNKRLSRGAALFTTTAKEEQHG